MEPGVFVIIIPQVSVPANTSVGMFANVSSWEHFDTPSLAKVVIGTKGAQIKAIMEKSGTGLSWKRGQLG